MKTLACCRPRCGKLFNFSRPPFLHLTVARGCTMPTCVIRVSALLKGSASPSGRQELCTPLCGGCGVHTTKCSCPNEVCDSDQSFRCCRQLQLPFSVVSSATLSLCPFNRPKMLEIHLHCSISFIPSIPYCPHARGLSAGR